MGVDCSSSRVKYASTRIHAVRADSSRGGAVGKIFWRASIYVWSATCGQRISRIGTESSRNIPSGKLSMALVTALSTLSILQHLDHVATLLVGDKGKGDSGTPNPCLMVHLGSADIEARELLDLLGDIPNGSVKLCSRRKVALIMLLSDGLDKVRVGRVSDSGKRLGRNDMRAGSGGSGLVVSFRQESISGISPGVS